MPLRTRDPDIDPEWTVSVDPAGSKDTYAAWWCGGRLVGVGVFDPRDKMIRNLRANVIMEDQFGKHRGDRLLKLAKYSGWLIGTMGRELHDVDWVQPSVWKAALCKRSAPKTRRIEDYFVHIAIIKTLTKTEQIPYLTCLETSGSASVHSDIADSVGIGLYACGRIHAVL